MSAVALSSNIRRLDHDSLDWNQLGSLLVNARLALKVGCALTLIKTGEWRKLLTRTPNPTDGRDCVKTRITVSFLFVLVRVISWIDCLSAKSDPRNHTKPHEITPTRSLSLPCVGF